MGDSYEKNSLDRRGFLEVAGAALLGQAGTPHATPAASSNPTGGMAHFPSLNPASPPETTFLRDEKGGLFLRVENPFFEARYTSNRKVYPARVDGKFGHRSHGGLQSWK